MGEGEEVVKLAELGRRVQGLVLISSGPCGGACWRIGLLAPGLGLRAACGCFGLGRLANCLGRLRSVAGLGVALSDAARRQRRRASGMPRRGRSKGGGAGNDVEQAADVGDGELLRVLLCT